MNISTELSIMFMLFWKEEIMFVLARRDKDKGKDIDELFYILSQLLK